jgi:hypothetical protein
MEFVESLIRNCEQLRNISVSKWADVMQKIPLAET